MIFQLRRSRERRAWQGAGILLLVIFALTVQGLSGWQRVLWFGGMSVVGLGWWRYTRWPTAWHPRVRYQHGRWWLQAASDDAWEHLPTRPLLVLPRVVGVPRQRGGGHHWLYRDQLNADDWRRLNICARTPLPKSRS